MDPTYDGDSTLSDSGSSVRSIVTMPDDFLNTGQEDYMGLCPVQFKLWIYYSQQYEDLQPPGGSCHSSTTYNSVYSHQFKEMISHDVS